MKKIHAVHKKYKLLIQKVFFMCSNLMVDSHGKAKRQAK